MDTHAQKISHLRTLYHLACADNEVKKIEAIYIKNVANFLGIPHEELSRLEPGEPDLVLPDREYKVYGLFHRLAIIIMIDENVTDREHRYCFNLGIKMGLHPNAVGEIIDHIRDKGAMQVMPSEIIKIFKRYLN